MKNIISCKGIGGTVVKATIPRYSNSWLPQSRAWSSSSPKWHQRHVLYVDSPLRCGNRADRFQFWFMCVLPLAVCAAHVSCSAGNPIGFGENTQDFYFCQMLEHNTAIQHRTNCMVQDIAQKQNKAYSLFSKFYFTTNHISLLRQQHYQLHTTLKRDHKQQKTC